MGRTALEVQSLDALFRRVENGEIKVPVYQRSFSWNNKQILRLIESVYKGYPIGTLVFWETLEEAFETAGSDATKLPDVSQEQHVFSKHSITYVIDGLQRLSSLYNCLRWEAVEEPSKFNIIFDLDSKTFLHFDRNKIPNDYIHLSSIFSPPAFSQKHPNLLDPSDFQRLLTAITDLRERFIEYEVIITTLAEYAIDEVYFIFELLNSTGTRLTQQEILQARAKQAKQDH